MKKGIIIAIIIIVLGGFSSWKAYHFLLPFKIAESIEFSKEKWNNSVDERGTMLNDLLTKYNFVGMTKEEIIDLLGENGLSIGNESLRYDTGGGYFKDEVLFFSIDQFGIVKNFGIAN